MQITTAGLTVAALPPSASHHAFSAASDATKSVLPSQFPNQLGTPPFCSVSGLHHCPDSTDSMTATPAFAKPRRMPDAATR